MSTEALDAQRLLELSQAAYDVDHANAVKAEAGTLTGDDIEGSIAAHREVAQACEAFRRRYYPRSGRVIAALGGVHVLSPKGRRGRVVAEVQWRATCERCGRQPGSVRPGPESGVYLCQSCFKREEEAS